jgi:hypothetical protein
MDDLLEPRRQIVATEGDREHDRHDGSREVLGRPPEVGEAAGPTEGDLAPRRPDLERTGLVENGPDAVEDGEGDRMTGEEVLGVHAASRQPASRKPRSIA